MSRIRIMEKILFEYSDLNHRYAIESAWAEKVSAYYKLDNILFYANNYSWGDLVEVENRSGELYVTRLIKESGHTTVRLIFYRTEIVEPTRIQLKEMGCESEVSNIPSLISVDIPPKVDYKSVKQFLDNGEEKEIWSYQEACLAHTL
jgi:hypothetical protein